MSVTQKPGSFHDNLQGPVSCLHTADVFFHSDCNSDKDILSQVPKDKAFEVCIVLYICLYVYLCVIIIFLSNKQHITGSQNLVCGIQYVLFDIQVTSCSKLATRSGSTYQWPGVTEIKLPLRLFGHIWDQIAAWPP